MALNLCIFSEIYESEMWDMHVQLNTATVFRSRKGNGKKFKIAGF